jgi:hypothetical protein
LGEEDPLSVLPMALSEINETRPYKSAYGHDIGHDSNPPLEKGENASSFVKREVERIFYNLLILTMLNQELG